MSIIVERFWTLKRDGTSVTLKQYKIRSVMRGDYAVHLDCLLSQQFEMPIDDLPSFMVECGITEFERDDDAQFMIALSPCGKHTRSDTAVDE